jgi:MYXO-CTERM domain-containing protein
MNLFRLMLVTMLIVAFQIANPAAANDALERLKADSRTTPVIHGNPSDSTPHVIGKLNLNMPGPDSRIRAQAFIEKYRDLFLPEDSLSEVRLDKVLDTSYGRVTKLSQYFEGIPVYGASISVGEDRLKNLRLAVNSLRPVAQLKKQRKLAEEKIAIANAVAAFTYNGSQTRDKVGIETVWFATKTELILTYLVTVHGADPLGDTTYLVAGPQATILYFFVRSPMAAGYAYESNPINDTYKQVDLPYLTSDQHLTGSHVTVYNCAGTTDCGTREQLAAPDLNGDYLIEPTGDNDPALFTDMFVEVQAYYAINTIHDYFVDVGWSPSAISVEVNYRMSSPNAMYGNDKITMGQSSYLDTAVENDIIFHEYGHHVFGQIASSAMFEMDQYGPVSHGLAMNEATADYYSCSALNDPEMAEYFAETMGPAYFPNGWMRNSDNNLTCPDGLYGEAHDDSMIWSGFLWDVRDLLGQTAADQLYLDVLSAFPSEVKYPTVTQVYMETAALTLDQTTMNQIQALVDQRGIADCERFIGLKTVGHTGYIWGKAQLGGMASGLDFIPGELHYLLEIPANATELSISWDTQPPSGMDVVLLVRKDQPVEHSLVMGWPPSLNSTYDFILEADTTISLPSANPAFEVGHTYYFHPANRGQSTGEYTVFGNTDVVSTDGGTDGGADAGGDTTSPDGGDSDLPPECPDGYDAAKYDGEWVCVPLCKDGFEPKLENGTWVCGAKSSGCGCQTSGKPAMSLGLMLFGLAIWLRRKN